MGRVSDKVYVGFNWNDGDYIEKVLSKSFTTLEQAKEFAENKDVVDIYRFKGKYRVEWKKKFCK